jgi:hypothetical protein
MKKHLWLAVVLLLLTAFAHATTPVTGSLKDLATGVVQKNSKVRLWLRGCAGNQPRVNGTALIAPSQGNVYFKDFLPDVNGLITGTVYSTRDAAGTGNGEIQCGTSQVGTWYGVQVFVNGVGGPETPVHAKNGVSLDLTSALPISTTPVVTAPTGDSTYARLDGVNQPFTGPVTVPSATVGGTLGVTGLTSLKNEDNIRKVSNGNPQGWAGADAFAWITSAQADLPATGGIVDARGLGANTFAVSTQLNVGSASKPVQLLIDPTTRFNVNTVGGIDAITVANASSMDCGGVGQRLGGFSTAGMFVLGPSANVNTLITNADQSGSQEYMRINGCIFQGNQTATIVTALGSFKQLFVNSIVSNNVFQGPMTGTTVLVDNVGVGMWFNNWVNGTQGVASTVNPMIVRGATGNFSIIGGAIEHPGGGKPVVLFDSSTGGNPGVCNQSANGMYGTYIENATGGGNGIEFLDSCAWKLDSVSFAGNGPGPGAGDAIKISETVPGTVKQIRLINIENKFSTYLNTLNDTTTGGSVYTSASKPRIADYATTGSFSQLADLQVKTLKVNPTSGVALLNTSGNDIALAGAGSAVKAYLGTLNGEFSLNRNTATGAIDVSSIDAIRLLASASSIDLTLFNGAGSSQGNAIQLVNGGLLQTPQNTKRVATNFTTANNTNLQTITGLSWTLDPTTARNYSFHCSLSYSQATANVAVAFGIQASTTAPTNIFANGTQQITVGPPATFVTGTLATLTTTTAINIVSGTPGALTTNYTATLDGTIENPVTAPNNITIMVSTAAGADAVTVLRGSYCQLF